jgi:hypothetical protein
MAISGRRAGYSLLLTATAVWACNRGEKPADQPPARDLSLAPAESVAQMNDRPTDQPAAQPKQTRPPVAKPPAQRPATQPAQPQPKPREPAKAPVVGEGTRIDLVASDTITSRTHKKGEAITAKTASAVSSSDGRSVIPAGAVFSGTISDIAPAEHPGGQGRMVFTFNRVSFGGKNYAVQATVDTLGTVMKGRGVTAGEAVKVGAGAVIGGIAGRVLGGNKTGTAVGAAAGAAAGVGYAAATRDVDIILPAGALVRIILTAPFELKEIAE